MRLIISRLYCYFYLDDGKTDFAIINFKKVSLSIPSFPTKRSQDTKVANKVKYKGSKQNNMKKIVPRGVPVQNNFSILNPSSASRLEYVTMYIYKHNIIASSPHILNPSSSLTFSVSFSHLSFFIFGFVRNCFYLTFYEFRGVFV